jgi:hypothetical protein
MFGQCTQIAPLVRPRIRDVADVRPVTLVKMPRLRAHQQVQLLVGFEPLGNLGDGPGKAPVSARWVLGMVCQEVDRHAHAFLPSRSACTGACSFPRPDP